MDSAGNAYVTGYTASDADHLPGEVAGPDLTFNGGDDDAFVAKIAVIGGPTVTSLSPSSGPTAGGNTVTITGTNLLSASAVKFGGTAATSFTVVSSTKITAKAPAQAAGKVDVTVTGADGTSDSGAAGTGNDYYYTTRYEETAPRLAYSGTWQTITNASASGGSYKQTIATGAYVVIPFSGTRLYWVATTGPGMGDASVRVDGGAAVTVHLYSADPAYKVKVWDTGPLASGYHTVKIAWNGPDGQYIDLDAVDVAGTLTAVTRFQENNSHLLYAPAWTRVPDPAASAGAYRYTDTANAQVTINFTGVSISLVARKAPNYGKAYVSVDGGTAVLKDLYAAGATYATVWTSAFLTPGDHTVVITRAGLKNTASTGYAISLDAVDVRGVLR